MNRVLVTLCVLVSLTAVTLAWNRPPVGGRSLGGSTSSRFASLLKSRKSSLFGARVRDGSSIFSALSAKTKQPICYFDKNGVPQYEWPTKEKLCFDKSYKYPVDRVFSALEQDPDAMEYMLLVQGCYLHNKMNSTGHYPAYRYKDLCSENTELLERIWWTNTQNGRREVCYVIMPEAQGVEVAQCGGHCVMDTTEVKHHYCVPDGMVERDIYVFCPGEIKQCRRTRVTIPTGCSCKKYECLKYQLV
ncbi:uncharacterized protein [Haliotis cracherodii]|uniref:uncharacterized protein n=1 Tax=Haliotis cracherodii TaxID=6455 RepID=UPI0039EA426E